ncbi:MAG: hypothetical protein ACRDDX_08500 [Cellulosilyticaceae bacterium]
MFLKKICLCSLFVLCLSLCVGCGRIKPSIEDQPTQESNQQVDTTSSLVSASATNEEVKKTIKPSGENHFATMPLDEVFFDLDNDKPYIEGVYPEVDFALDLLTRYLNNDESIYDSLVWAYNDSFTAIEPISADAKKDLVNDLKAWKSELAIDESASIKTTIDAIQFKGYDFVFNEGIYLALTLKISPEGNNNTFWHSYAVHVFERDGEFVSFIFSSNYRTV